MTCARGNRLRLQEVFFLYGKLLCWMLISVLAVCGCSTSKVQVSAVALASEQAIPQLQLEEPPFFLEYDFESELEEKLRHEDFFEEEEESKSEVNEISTTLSSEEFHQEEVVGFTFCVIREPELLEDPWIEANCADSAFPWCDPTYEDHYQAYLEREEGEGRDPAIFPNFISPIDNGLVLRGMYLPSKKRRGHYGLDIIPQTPDRHGFPIKAVEDGVVVRVSQARGYGYYLVLYHQNGLFSLYSHIMKKNCAQVGQVINRGDTIAYMGKSGNARGYHLHFELIDLRENWELEESIDDFVQRITEGDHIQTCHCNQFSQMLFAKQFKKDPLLSIPGLFLAKRVNGKWVAVNPSEKESSNLAEKE